MNLSNLKIKSVVAYGLEGRRRGEVIAIEPVWVRPHANGRESYLPFLPGIAPPVGCTLETRVLIQPLRVGVQMPLRIDGDVPPPAYHTADSVVGLWPPCLTVGAERASLRLEAAAQAAQRLASLNIPSVAWGAAVVVLDPLRLVTRLRPCNMPWAGSVAIVDGMAPAQALATAQHADFKGYHTPSGSVLMASAEWQELLAQARRIEAGDERHPDDPDEDDCDDPGDIAGVRDQP